METQNFRTLLVVLELGSFSKAANELCITQSAVSQRIKLMEERYGHSLLERSGQVVRPTNAGLIIKKKAEQILKLEKEMELEIGGLDNKNRLSLCSTPTFGVVYLPKILNRFFLENSADMDFKFVLNTPEQSLKGLLENEFDLAIIEHCCSIEMKEATIYELSPDELIFISSPSLSLSRPGISLEELLTQRLIARREGCSSRCLLQENLKRFNKTLDDFGGMIIYDDLHLTIQNVLDGRGVAFVSKSLVHDYLQREELHGHAVEGFQCFRSRSVILPDRHRENHVIKNFMESVFAVFGLPVVKL
jgi:DNA-binding transcriptional LysR family regulator